MVFRATFDCLWCGTRPRRARRRTTWRALPSSVRTASAGPARTASCASGSSRPWPSRRSARRRAVVAGPAQAALTAPGRGPVGRDAGLLRSPGPEVRRLVPASSGAIRAGRSTTWPGTPSSTRPRCGSMACRSGARSSSWRPAPAGGRPCWPARASCRSTTPTTGPSTGPGRGSLAHGLRAHIHVRDAWAEPDRAVDALFCGFWLSHVPRAAAGRVPRACPSLAQARRSRSPSSTRGRIRSPARSTSRSRPDGEVSRRRLADGREFDVVKVYWQPAELEAGPACGRLRDARGHDDCALLPARPGAARNRILGPMSPLVGAHDRDRRLRRHGRGDDRRPAPGQARRARPGHGQPSPPGTPRAAPARVRHPDRRRQRRGDPRGRRDPAGDQAPDARPGRAPSCAGRCGPGSSSCRSSPGPRPRPWRASSGTSGSSGACPTRRLDSVAG